MSNAGVVSGRRLRVHAKLGHQPGTNIVIVKIAPHPQLGHLYFARPKYFTRPADRVVSWIIEIVDIRNVGSDLRREELAVKRRFFGARIAIEPGPVGESKRFGRLSLRITPSLGGGLALRLGKRGLSERGSG